MNTKMQSTKSKLSELQAVITKLPMDVCINYVVPEFGVHWRQVTRLIRNTRLPMQPSSVARVLCKHASNMSLNDLDYSLQQFRLTLAATQPRTWHVLLLQELTTDEPVTELLRMLPHRILTALRNGKFGSKIPEVQSVMMGDFVFISVQLVSATSRGSTLFLATPPGKPIALVSSLTSGKILKACAEGLGYASYQNANLYGKDKASLLRIADPAWNGNADHLTNIPPYNPAPVILPNGIDYTNRAYDEQYVDNIIGPNPPLLTELKLITTRSFFDRSRLNKPIKVTMTIKSDNLAKTLRGWALKGVIAPTSEFFHIFHKMKSNVIKNNYEDSESD